MTDKCNKCDGSGLVERDDRAYECVCAFTRRIAAGMPAYIRSAIVKPEHVALPLMKAYRQNCRVLATWQDMRAILKILIIKNPKLFIKNTSDREIRDVFVGAKSRAARGGDEAGAIYNSLEDLMDPPDLMVVRLNELSYKNKAAAGALEEALNYRLNCMKPTWILSDVDRPFTVGSHAYSESIASILTTSFVVAKVPRILPTPRLDDMGSDLELPEAPSIGGSSLPGQSRTGPITPEPVETPSLKRVRPLRPPEPEEARELRKKYDDDEPKGGTSIYGRGIPKSKKFQGRD